MDCLFVQFILVLFFYFSSFLAVRQRTIHQNQFWSLFIPVNRGGQIYNSSNLYNSHSLSRSIHGVRFLKTNALTLLLQLHLPCLLCSSSLPLAPHFKLQRFSQNVPNIPPQHMPLPPHSIHLCHLNHCFLIIPNISIRSSVLFFSISFAPHIALTIALLVLLKIAISFSLINTMSHFHITTPILHNSDKTFLSASARTFLSSATPCIP